MRQQRNEAALFNLFNDRAGAAGINQLSITPVSDPGSCLHVVFVDHHVVFDTNAAERFSASIFCQLKCLLNCPSRHGAVAIR